MQEEKEATGSRPRPLDNLQEDEGSSLVLPPRPPPPEPPFSLFRVSNEKVAEPDKLLSPLASCTHTKKT